MTYLIKPDATADVETVASAVASKMLELILSILNTPISGYYQSVILWTVCEKLNNLKCRYERLA